MPFAAERLYPQAGHAGFLVRIPEAEHLHLLALGIVAPGMQRLAEPALVMGDQPGGGAEDRGGGAVIRLQPDDFGAGEVVLEAEDVLDLGAAPGIDALIVVADAADVFLLLRQQAQPVILHLIGVLVLVDQDIAEAAVILRQHLRVGPEQPVGEQEQIAEIHGVQRQQALLVGGIEVAARMGAELHVLVGGDGIGREAAILPALDRRHQPLRRETLGVEIGPGHHLLEQAELVVGVEDGEVAGKADTFGVAAQHSRGEGVEGAQPEALRRLAEQGGNPFAHLARRLVGEGDGENLARPGAPG